MIKYQHFLEELDKKLSLYFSNHQKYICCQKGCSYCCERGDYPISKIELEYLMQGYIKLNYDAKKIVQNNIKNIIKGGQCPFLVNKECSIYNYRPIICRVHGIAYLCKDNMVKIPYCVNLNKNYAKVYQNGTVTINPVLDNLDTPNLLRDFEYGDIRNLYDWIKI